MSARMFRKALDVTLVSMETIQYVVEKGWGSSKLHIMKTRAKPLVNNRFLTILETRAENLMRTMKLKTQTYRDQQLRSEIEYLEKEIEKAKNKIKGKGAAKSAQSFGATSWKYAKVEVVPPLTVNIFNGPIGKKLENFAGKMSNGFIQVIAGRIKEMDAEKERKRLEILAAIQAHENKVKAEAKAKEVARIKERAREAAEAVKKANILAEKAKAEEAAKKPKEDPKAKAKEAKPKPKKKPPKKK